MKTTVVEVRIHLPTGEIVTLANAEDVITYPPLNLRTPMVALFEGEQPQQMALPLPLVAVMYRDPKDRAIWRRWYGASLEIVERESLIETVTPRLV